MALLLASLIAYLRSYMSAGGRRAAWLCSAALGYAASLLTYPVALGVPFLLVGLDWLRSRADPRVGFRRLLAEKAAFFVPLAAVLAVTLAARIGAAQAYGEVPGLRELPLSSRIAQSAYVAAYYAWKPWWPSHLSPLYDTLVGFSPTDPPFLLSVASVAAASAFAILAFRRRPAIAVVWFGYLAVASPFFGLTEIPHMTSDRYGCFLTVITAAVIAAGLASLSKPRARLWATAASLALIAILARLSWRQLDAWPNDRVQHAYVLRGLANAELLDYFSSRQLILEFMRGNEEEASEAVASGLRANPASPGLQKAAAIIADKRRISAYYGPVSMLAILQDQLALGFAREGQFREADDHFSEALREDGRFYQAAYDRSLVLLRLGRCDDALRSYLAAERWASTPLPAAQRAEFLGRLERLALAAGRPDVAHAVQAALHR